MGVLWWIVMAVLLVVPLWQLMPKFRLPEWVALIAVLPFGVVILLWVMAYRDRLRIPGIDR